MPTTKVLATFFGRLDRTVSLNLQHGRTDQATMMKGVAIAALSATLVSSDARSATPFDALIAPVAGEAACFTRVYDAAHLRQHPKQKVASLTVWLRYESVNSDKPVTALAVSLALTERGRPDALYSDGGCTWDANRDTSDRRLIKADPKDEGMVCLQSAQPDVFDVTSAEEGGNLILDRGKDRDTLMIYLDNGLAMVKRANRGQHRYVEFGPDDRVFMLRRTDIKNCAAIEDAVTTPEPGAAPGPR